jgi:putative GTP pyrophosphokinase
MHETGWLPFKRPPMVNLHSKAVTVEEPIKAATQFDFVSHVKSAVYQYSKKRHLYDDFAVEIENILQQAIETRGLKINVIQGRAKSEESFGKKAAAPSEEDPDKPKYPDPMKQITDLAGVRVITFFPSTVGEIGGLVQEEFEILERVDHTASAEQEERLGYLSVHYLVRLGSNRCNLPEYKKFAGLTAEIQVRTVLQHAWAEIEHDIRYKSTSAIPHAISRRFMALAGLLEIADREFEAIQTEDATVRANALSLIADGRLGEVEVTPDSLRSYLDVRLGPDDRISDYTYEWMTKILRNMGFQNLAQINECIANFDDDKCSRIALGSRSGQMSRFEVQLAASMGENYIAGHLWSAKSPNGWWATVVRRWLEELKKAGVQLGTYQPRKD